ncbi:uncharacterized protein LOC128953212 [Oppia nitens]|uniref:uncharacterized protein LOC128953212 n=1 Tax=Oppia nitens TaxID=1686743 RepID=UPI0023D9E590|nr:uncharacterized protein LOC128953212 [Oppia nitens]
MKVILLIGLLCCLAYGLPTDSNVERLPYEWNPFILNVKIVIAEIQTVKSIVEKDIDEHPDDRLDHLKWIDSLLVSVQGIQTYIDDEFKSKDELTQSQIEELDGYKIKALRYHQELDDLRKKI